MTKEEKYEQYLKDALAIGNSILQYTVGFFYLGGRSLFRISKKTFTIAFENIHALFPFLSQDQLLKWSKGIVEGTDNIYDRALDQTYNETSIGGPNHRLFDGGHDPVSAWGKIKDVSDTDSFTSEVIGYVTALWKDVTTQKGLPFATVDKEKYDTSAEWVATHVPGADKNWFYDLLSFDVFEVLSTSLGLCGAIFFLKKEDVKKLSEILGSLGIVSVLGANPLMGISLILFTSYAYVVKKKEFDKGKALKGAGYTTISMVVFSVLGLPVLLELFIVLNIIRLIKGETIIGSNFVKKVFKKISVRPRDEVEVQVFQAN